MSHLRLAAFFLALVLSPLAAQVTLNPAPAKLAVCTSELWLPDGVTPQAVVCFSDYANGKEFFRAPGWRKLATELRLAFLLHKIVEHGQRHALCKEREAFTAIEQHLKAHAQQFKQPALATVPLIYVGTSQAGPQAFALAWQEPRRCAAVIQMQSAVASVQWWTRDHAADEKVRAIPMLYNIGGRDFIGAQNNEAHACSRLLLRNFIGPAVVAGAQWRAYLKADEGHGGTGDQSYNLTWLSGILAARLAPDGSLRPLPAGIATTLEWRISAQNPNFQEAAQFYAGTRAASEFEQSLWFLDQSQVTGAAGFMRIKVVPSP